MIKETGESFGDESHIIYVNSQIKNETALGKLLLGINLLFVFLDGKIKV